MFVCVIDDFTANDRAMHPIQWFLVNIETIHAHVPNVIQSRGYIAMRIIMNDCIGIIVINTGYHMMIISHATTNGMFIDYALMIMITKHLFRRE